MAELPDGYELSFDPVRIDHAAVHAYLTRSYWSPGIPIETVSRALAGSLCVSVFKEAQQAAFARLVTDRATFAYLADVFVLEEHRGKGISKAMMLALQEHPDTQGLRRWMLATRDAHGLYEGLGWSRVSDPSTLMMRHFPDVYA